jgi:hypothetical protein
MELTAASEMPQAASYLQTSVALYLGSVEFT